MIMNVKGRLRAAAIAAAVLIAGAGSLALVLPAASQAPAVQGQRLSKDQEAQVRTLIRQYLLENPEVLEEAQKALEEKKRLAAWRQITTDGRAFAQGPANAQVTLVEFFDYNCPYCKVSINWMLDTVRTRKDVRVIFVDLPILGPGSIEAARAAIASQKQGRYLQFHQALMGTRGQITQDRIDAVARSVGLDVARLRRDMQDPAIDKALADNNAAAMAVGVQGTPAFMVNGKMMNFGGVDDVNAALRDAAKAKRAS
jgi:protein-disulfide isomerase